MAAAAEKVIDCRAGTKEALRDTAREREKEEGCMNLCLCESERGKARHTKKLK